MKAMVLPRIVSLSEVSAPLKLVELPTPEPGPHEVLVRVSACGVCHTELDEIEGRTPPPRLPVVLGHEAIGRVERLGDGVRRLRVGDRVGVGWIHSSDASDRENLSPRFQATGRDMNGGYAEYLTVPESYAYSIPEGYSDVEAAPLLCAGAIGFRALELTEIADGDRVGLMGFGASAHLVLQLIQGKFPRSEVLVFARDEADRLLAERLGAVWVGGVEDRPQELLHAIIDTTPAWKPIVEALACLRPGGRLVINAIRKEDRDKDQLMRLSYHDHLWMEKEIKTVANITQFDIRNFLPLAASIGIRPVVTTYRLEDANEALVALRRGGAQGALVLTVGTHGEA